MNDRRRIQWMLLLLLFAASQLGGCAARVLHRDAQQYNCDDGSSFTATTSTFGLKITRNGESQTLKRIASDSGEKFQGRGEIYYFTGDTATIGTATGRINCKTA